MGEMREGVRCSQVVDIMCVISLWCSEVKWMNMGWGGCEHTK